MSHRPHPILKRDSSPFRTPTLPFSTCGPLFSPHVHFPPTPRLVAGTYPAHSPATYDRAPIAVSPNACSLPRRGERDVRSPPVVEDGRPRGRSRTRGKRGETVKGSYFHPRAYEACKPEPPNVPPPTFALPSTPPLVHDLSPSSDESESTVTTPPDPNVAAAIASCPIPLHLPNSPSDYAPRRRPHPDKADVGSPPPALRSPFGAKANGRGRRPNFVRKETRLASDGRTVSFSPDMDEGCLGGF